MKVRVIQTAVASAVLVAAFAACLQATKAVSTWQDEFDIAGCDLSTASRNQDFILEPGYLLAYQLGRAVLTASA
jgi:hypothetical protein